MAEKNMIIALVISFILTGLGIAYAGDIKKGLTIFVIAIMLNVLGFWVHFAFSIIGIVVWINGLYATYLEVNAVN